MSDLVQTPDIPHDTKFGISPRVAPLMLIAFALVFLGPGPFQYYIRDAAPAEWSAVKVASILGALYTSFLFFRFLIVPSQHLLTDKWCLVLGALTYALVPAAFLVTTNYAVLIAVSIVWGWGAAGLWQTAYVWLYDNTSASRRGLWVGILYAVVFVAMMTGSYAEGLAAGAGKRTLLLFMAAAPGVLGAGIAALLPARRARAEALSIRNVTSMLLDGRVAILGLVMFISAIASGLVLGSFRDRIALAFGPAFLGTVLAAHFGVRLAMSLAGGYSSDVFARRWVLALVFVAAAGSLAAAAMISHSSVFIAAVAGLGAAGMIATLTSAAFAADWFPPEKRAYALAAAFVWNDAGLIASLMGGQWLVELTGGFNAPLIVFSAMFLAGAAISLFLPDSRPRESNVKGGS